MKSIILASIAASSLAVLLASPAAAQTAPENSNAGASGFTAKNVNRIRPFGSINVYNVGVDLAHVSTWVKTLSPAEKQEMVGRCSVIIQNQQNYYSETTTFCQNFAIAVAESVSANGNTR
jgi:hypothetical protein